MKNRLIHIFSVAMICLLPGLLYSQQRSEKRHYTFEKIEMKTPWLLSGNGAGLVFNRAENYANLEGFFTNESGDYRNFDDPSTYTAYGLETKSYTKVNGVYFYGAFKYDYGVNEDLAWRGTVYPRTNLNPIVDSIPGKVLRESYIMSGKVGYNLTDRISIGAAFDYNTSTSAKRVDGRNLNTLSMLNVSPGIIFNTGLFKFGVNLNYKRDVEQVDYDYIGDETGKYINYMEGLWFYSTAGITNTTELERKYIKDIFGGSLQAHLRAGDLCFFNQFSVNYGQTDNYEESNFTKRYAYNESMNYVYDGRLRLIGDNVDHFLILSFESDENLSYSVVNRYERVPGEANSWAYYEYGKDLRYISDYQKYGAEYKLFIREGEWRCSWILAAGFNTHIIEKNYKLFPARYDQDVTLNEIYIRANRDFVVSDKGSINVDINGSTISADGTMLDATNPLTSGSLRLNSRLLEQDYEYISADRFTAGLGMKYKRVMNEERGSLLYLGASYKHMDAGDLGSRGFFSLSLGYNF